MNKRLQTLSMHKWFNRKSCVQSENSDIMCKMCMCTFKYIVIQKLTKGNRRKPYYKHHDVYGNKV